MILIFLIQLQKTLPKPFSTMCQMIDCSMFKSFGTYLKCQDEGESMQKDKILKLLDENNNNFRFQQLAKITDKNSKFHSLILQVRDKLDVMLQIEFRESSVTLKTKYIYISQLFIIRNRVNKLLVAKQIMRVTFNRFPQQTNTKFSPFSGQISIEENLRITKNNIKEQLKQFSRLLESFINKSVFLFYQLQKISSQNTEDNLSQEPLMQKKIHPILRYLSRSTIEPSFSIKSQCAQYGSLIKTYASSYCDLQDLAKFNSQSFQTTNLYFKNLGIYGLNYKIDNKRIYMSDMMLNQKQKIQAEIVIPSLSLLRSNQNKFVFNHCYFFANQYPEKKIDQGGNSQIYVLKVDVHEYSTASNEKDKVFVKNPKINQYISKHLIYKKIKESQAGEKKNSPNLQNHQSLVLQNIRGGTCLYLPKFYLNIEKATQYNQKFFMDYIPGDTLDKFLSLNATTISTITKIWLMFQVTQALRFISQYGIVHLDVKETNVIVMKKLICKLFDFGEAYHFKVGGTEHKPKYSMLYGSPQVVTNKEGRGFNQKSDVYSLGIMMHNTFFEKYPYFFSDQKAFQQANFGQSLRKRTFYVPQDFEERGDQNIMIILSQLVFKCMQMDEKARPFIDWVGLILKNCLNYLVSD